MAKKFLTSIDLKGTINTTGNITAPEVHATTKLVGDTVGGDEGGEILLGVPQTNTTIAGTGVTIDVWQNKLRFFEQGGSARGFYIDITSGGAGVGTNLVGGGSGTVTSVAMTVPTGLTVSGSPITTSGTLAVTLAAGYSIPTTSSQTNWDSAYTDRLKWDGGSTGLTASTGRTSLGATTVGSNLFTLTDPGAITFLKVNANNTVSTESASTYRTSLGLGTMATETASNYALLAGPTFTGTVTAATLNLTTADSTSTASHYWFATGSDGVVRPKTLANVKTEIVTTAAVNSAAATTVGTVTSGTWNASTIGLAYGGTGATSAPAAMANLMGYTSTATAAGTTTLTNTSSFYQQFTGSSTQTVQLPVTSTLTTGWTFHIVNNSTGNLTVNSSGGNAVITVIPGTTAMVTCIGTALTTAADWEAGLTDFSTYTGTGSVVLSTSPTLTGNVSVGTVTSGTWNGSIIGATYGGTGNGFTAFSGPTTSTKTFTLPNASATILTDNAAVTAAQGGTGQTSYTIGDIIYASGTTAVSKLGIGTAGQALVVNAGATAPSWTTLDMTYIPGATWKKSVRVATTAALGGTYSNGTSGVGATLTITSTTTLDGVTLANGDRILVKDQATAAQNGIYTRTSSTVLTRATDADTNSEIGSAVVAIDEGTTNGGELFTTIFKATDTVGTTAMSWYKILDYSDLLTSGSTSTGAVSYTGTTKSAGKFDGGTTAPSNTTRLNYDGYLYATRFYGDGSNLTNVSVSTLGSIGDVTITSNTSGEILKWNGTAWINNTLAEAGIAATSHTHAAGDVTSGTFGISLIPTGTTSTTVALGNHNHTLDSLSNTTITSNTSGEILKWNGTAWVNNTLTEAGIMSNPMTAAGDIIYGGTSGTPTAKAGNTSTTKQFLSSTGTGTAAQAPAWGALAVADIPTLTSAKISDITLGGALTFSGAFTTSFTVSANTTLTLPTTGTLATTSQIPTVNDGALNVSIGTAGATNTTLTWGTSTGFTANDATATTTYDLKVGPALTALATIMTGATTGVLNKTAADSYSLVSVMTNPMTTPGDMIYGGVAGAATRLAGQTAANQYFLSSTGTGTAAGNPTWTLVSTLPNWYPTTFTWTAGTTSGPTGSLTGTGMGAVSYAAIPSASGTASGIVTTGTQTFSGTKVFGGTTSNGATIQIGRSTATPTAAANYGVVLNDTANGNSSMFSNLAATPIYVQRTDTPSASALNAIEFASSTTLVGKITVNQSATAYSTSSDYRLKDNIAPIDNAIVRLLQLKPSRFNFIVDPSRIVDGFIAHEAQEVVPEAVVGEKDEVDENGNPIYQGIDQAKLVPLLTAALQDAVKEIEDLKAENESLSTYLSSIISRLDAAGI